MCISCPRGFQTTHPLGAEDDCGGAMLALQPRGLDIGPLWLVCLKPGVWPRQKHRKSKLPRQEWNYDWQNYFNPDAHYISALSHTSVQISSPFSDMKLFPLCPDAFMALNDWNSRGLVFDETLCIIHFCYIIFKTQNQRNWKAKVGTIKVKKKK